MREMYIGVGQHSNTTVLLTPPSPSYLLPLGLFSGYYQVLLAPLC